MSTNLSRLGFGLSGIAGSGNYQHQEKLVRTAIDCGVTHFDVAPYYGSGDAEKILGKILANCTEKVTVTTKYGLMPVGGGAGGSMLRSILRPVFNRAKSLKRLASAVVKNNTASPHVKTFEKGALSMSLQESEKKLRRPADVLLLHDADVEFATNTEIIYELDMARGQKAVAFTGISGKANAILDVVNWRPRTYSIAQLENSLTLPAPVSQLRGYGANVITHRAIQGGLEELTYLIKKRPGFKQVWAREIGVDPMVEDNIAQALVELALAENSFGTVLFSTTKVERIKKIADAKNNPLLDENRALGIRKLFDAVHVRLEKADMH